MTGPQQRRCVFLIGFMGAGKTSVGRLLAQRLGWKFYDLDQLIEDQQQETIAGIFSAAGENGFRKIESNALVDLLEKGLEVNSVVALGGGAFMQSRNREALQRAQAVTVLLSAPVKELKRRCRASGASRPLAQDETRFEQLFKERQQAYALAQFRVDTMDKRIEEVAEEIERILGIA